MPKYDEFNAIFGALRRCWARHPSRRAVIDAGIHPTKVGPRGGKLVDCQDCGELFSRNNIAVDHIDPVVPVGVERRSMSWDEVVDRMFHCGDDNLQRLCKTCHNRKTKKENKSRKEAKRDDSKRGS